MNRKGLDIYLLIVLDLLFFSAFSCSWEFLFVVSGFVDVD